jgi:hypothetical protein
MTLREVTHTAIGKRRARDSWAYAADCVRNLIEIASGCSVVVTLGVIRGSLPRRALALVLEWATEHRDELLEDWNLCSRMQTPKAIEPLK